MLNFLRIKLITKGTIDNSDVRTRRQATETDKTTMPTCRKFWLVAMGVRVKTVWVKRSWVKTIPVKRVQGSCFTN